MEISRYKNEIKVILDDKAIYWSNKIDFRVCLKMGKVDSAYEFLLTLTKKFSG